MDLGSKIQQYVYIILNLLEETILICINHVHVDGSFEINCPGEVWINLTGKENIT